MLFSISVTRPTQAAQAVGRLSFYKLQQTKTLLFSERSKLVPCSDSIDKVRTEFSVNQDLQGFMENIDEDQPGDEFRHRFPLMKLVLSTTPNLVVFVQVEYSFGIFQTRCF